jgi:WD40 repeat protein
MNKNKISQHVCIVTTKKVPSIVGSQATDAAQILDPQTGSILSANGGSSTLKTGPGMGIQSFYPIPLRNNQHAYIATCGKSADDVNAYLIVQGSTSSPKWKCRLPEQMDGGIIVSPCGNYIIGAAKSGNCYCWSTFQEGELLRVWSAHYRSIQAVTFSDCGSFLVTGGADGIINAWCLMDIVSQESTSRVSHGRNHRATLNPFKTWSEHQLPITAMHTLPSSRIVSTSIDRQVVIIELFSGKTLAKIAMPAAINAITADSIGSRIYLGSVDGTIYCVDMDSYAIATTAEGAKMIENSHRNEFDDRGPSLSGSFLEETILGMDAQSSSESSHYSELKGHEGEVVSLELLEENGDGMLVSGGDDGSIRIWDIRSRCCIRTVYPWSTAGSNEKDTSKACSCSSITKIPRDSIESKGFDMFSTNVSNSKQNTNSVDLIKPLQRYPKATSKDAIEYVTNIVGPMSETLKRKKFVPSDEIKTHSKRKRTETNSDDLNKSLTENKTLDAENWKLRNELASAKETIERWQQVNSKLAKKFKKAMS